MAAAVAMLPSIDRRDCRLIMEERFSDRYLVNAFEEMYRNLTRLADF
jgi:hypothetical protein